MRAWLGSLRVIPILGGLGAALCWGLSTVVASRSTRLIGSQQALAYVMLLGFIALGLLIPLIGLPAHAGADCWGWAVLAGAGSAAGLSMMYRALRAGKVGWSPRSHPPRARSRR